MNERLKKLRKVLDLTQQEFADRIGVKRNTIATYEIGRNIPLDAVIASICREFNVNEAWLRTGEGEMFQPAPNGVLDAFIRERNLSPSDRVLIDKFAALDAASRQMVVDYVLSVADEIQAAPAAGKDIPVPAAPPSLEEKIAELERQNQELAAKVAATEEEDAGQAVGRTG